MLWSNGQTHVKAVKKNLPPNHLPVILLLAQIHVKAAKNSDKTFR